MRTSSTLAALASCVLPALVQAKAGDNCGITGHYTVVSGDTLGAIASQKHVTVAQIQYVNPTITNPDFIYIGEVISIPNVLCDTGSSTATPAPACSDLNRPKTYTVVSGDTLYIIATQKFGITLEYLEAANPQITNPNVLSIGQVINIPACPTPELKDCSENGPSTYTVVSGDSLYDIATKKFGITLAALEAKNPQITNPDLIYPGEVVSIPVCDNDCPSELETRAEPVVEKKVMARVDKKSRIGN